MLTCNLAPFEDPPPDMLQLVSDMTARIHGEEALRKLEATAYERRSTHQKRFLRKNNYDLEVSINQWKDWVQWRHELEFDSIEDSDILNEKEEGILAWRGQNKEKMKCCVITGRNLDPINRAGSARSFKRYFMKTMEDGLKAVDEDDQDKVCFIYDRRGLEYKHIDPNLFTFCKKVSEEMRDWYSDRVGVIYVIHVNIFFWLLYTFLVQPTMGFFNSSFNKKFILVDKPEDLMEYFDEHELLLNSYEEGAVVPERLSSSRTTLPEATASSTTGVPLDVSVTDESNEMEPVSTQPGVQSEQYHH